MSLPLSIPSPEWSFFDLGPFRIHAYAICILIGIFLATAMTSRRLTKRGGEPGVVLDIILWAVPLGIVGARIFHVLTHPNDYFYDGANLWDVFAVWKGGIAIFGALLGGAVGAYIGTRRAGIRFWSFADALAPGMLLAQAMGRLGNWFNHELFGLPTTLPWGLEISTDNPAYPVGLPAGTLFHPTFLYEIVWNLVGVAVILILERKFRLRWGTAFGVYLIWYGAGRSVFESIRVDPSEIFFGLRTNVWAALFAILVGLIIILVQSRRHTGIELSPYLPGREWKPVDPEVESGETDSVFEDHGNEADEPVESRDVDATSTTDSRP
ncbi:prolipoprotein diacylglyceryl transferase [Cryobacterium sp. TMN-39-2]|uniref:Phosphatidylglycerol--prolipoprotein diacylglyceryl transferase n=1 Tax=Cryobacterium zongtaii TaxID=1259217 RepID=A0A2S3ZJG1_9MICO|nr:MULTISPECIES: prolipoprotein diacylglyceryl transferase [Cryobacterium]POH65774.1 prolipoprotein diacylglyceryl transferase [Cryobacterium zongtaii]POH67697.1 prolipoprotein diacylglyceryl transferase [Cryobacterium zongtaii]TFC45199.1 prolipoprotein diacylglyceryl transferase [Cryobacterium sp. TMN-39-2]